MNNLAYTATDLRGVNYAKSYRFSNGGQSIQYIIKYRLQPVLTHFKMLI